MALNASLLLSTLYLRHIRKPCIHGLNSRIAQFDLIFTHYLKSSVLLKVV